MAILLLRLFCNVAILYVAILYVAILYQLPRDDNVAKAKFDQKACASKYA